MTELEVKLTIKNMKLDTKQDLRDKLLQQEGVSMLLGKEYDPRLLQFTIDCIDGKNPISWRRKPRKLHGKMVIRT